VVLRSNVLAAVATLGAMATALASAARADAGCTPDDPLADAAAELLLDSSPLTPERVSAAVRRAGSDLPVAHAGAFGERDGAARRAWLAELAARADAPLVCGSATGSRGRGVTVAAARAGRLDPIADAPDAFRPVLAPGFGSPYVVVLGADGVPTREPLAASDVTDGLRVPELVPRPAVLQLVATGPAGPRPVAERAIGAPSEPAPSVAAATAAAATDAADEPEGTDASRLGALRTLSGARPLRLNRLLVAAARRHAADVCAAGRVAHELEPGVGPEERLARAGVRARLVGEAVARSRTDASALSALSRSPSHRLTLVDNRFTDVGLGTARDAEGRTCLVIALAAWPRVMP